MKSLQEYVLGSIEFAADFTSGRCEDRQTRFSSHEALYLSMLAKAGDGSIHREQLAEAHRALSVKRYGYTPSAKAVFAAIANLRRKLNALSGGRDLIQSKHGRYRFSVDTSEVEDGAD